MVHGVTQPCTSPALFTKGLDRDLSWKPEVIEQIAGNVIQESLKCPAKDWTFVELALFSQIVSAGSAPPCCEGKAARIHTFHLPFIFFM